MIAFAKRLTDLISTLPARNHNSRLLAPSLAYGRHRGPTPSNTRRAAVAIAILRRPDGSRFIPLTTRPKSLKHHGGQVSLPGGKVEAGESDLQAAKREFLEELGVSIDKAICCGRLPPIYVYGSDNLVSPLMLVADAPHGPWQPDLLEVDRVIELPIEVLTSKHSTVRVLRSRFVKFGQETVGEFKFRALAYRYEQHRIWGATAILLGEVADLIRNL